MPSFSASIKADYADLHPDESERTLELLRVRLVDQNDGYLLSPGSMAPAMVHDLMQCGLRRSLELSDATIEAINAGQIVTSCVLVRAAFETECLVYDAAT